TPSLDAGEVEDVVDERSQALALFTNNAVVLLMFFWTGKASHFESLGVKPDEGKRCPQFVGNVGDEIGLQPRQRHLLGDVAIGQPNSAGQHQGERGQSKKTDAGEALADGGDGRAPLFDGQGQPLERAFQVPLYFWRATIPSAGFDESRGIVL